MQPTEPQRWDLFCRVIDNHGDLGVCWRLAADLAARGRSVRLLVDDARALAWMAPAGQPGVQVLPFDAAGQLSPAQVVVEAFGCDPPPAYVQAMAQNVAGSLAKARPAPVWLNLEYLSAEDYVERSHALPSPQAQGLMKWFFYPGFTRRTGGLSREPGLQARQAAFSRTDWLQALGVPLQPGERVFSLFCYPHLSPAVLQALLQHIVHSGVPTRLLLTPPAQPLLQGVVDSLPAGLPPGVHLHNLPWLSQHDYDHLLWASDLNVVRGEDSLVRAHWAGQPFVWHIYPQHDGVHAIKLQALLQRLQASPEVAALWHFWNGLPWATGPAVAGGRTQADQALATLLSPEGLRAWGADTRAWRSQLLAQDDLCTQLLQFVRAKATGGSQGAPG